MLDFIAIILFLLLFFIIITSVSLQYWVTLTFDLAYG